jgi:hypothetical protein
MNFWPFLSWSSRLRMMLRFTLRTMLAVMLVAAVFFAWFGWRLRKSQRQARAVTVLQELGALYAYDFQGPIVRSTARPRGKLVVTPGRSPFPRRLHDLLGIDFLHNITRVHLETSYRLADDDIDRLWNALGDLPDLVYLEASGPVTRPGAIRRLQIHRRLQRLALRWANIADGDLAVVAQLSRLEELNLNETPVTDAAMAQVGGSKRLEKLELHHAKITDSGLRDIAKLPRLRRLRLSATEIGDNGVRQLRNLKHLHDLDLEHTRITDAALSDVACLAELERLNLSLTPVTQQGFPQLERLSQLRSLQLVGTAVESDALQTIARLPNLEELFVDYKVVSGDLSPLADCKSLRRLSCPLGISGAIDRPFKLPPNLEEVKSVSLSDPVIFDELMSLPRLKLIQNRHSFSSLEKEQDDLAAEQKFRAIRPTVQIVRQ